MDNSLKAALDVIKKNAPGYFGITRSGIDNHSFECPAYTTPVSASIGRFSQGRCTCGFEARQEADYERREWLNKFKACPPHCFPVLEDEQCAVFYDKSQEADYGFSVYWKKSCPEWKYDPGPCFVHDYLVPAMMQM